MEDVRLSLDSEQIDAGLARPGYRTPAPALKEPMDSDIEKAEAVVELTRVLARFDGDNTIDILLAYCSLQGWTATIMDRGGEADE